jgi:hypothetical protein
MRKVFLLSVLFSLICIASYAQKTTKAKTSHPKDSIDVSAKKNEAFGENGAMNGMMNSFGPMVSNMAKSMMDAQLDYFKQPGKIEEIAKLQKQYFDALMKEGFNAEQALKIITSDGILPKSTGK